MNRKNTSAKAQRKRAEKQWLAKDLNSSELLLSFVGFLTTRDATVRISSSAPSEPIFQILGEFGKFHGLPPARKNRLLTTPPFLAENIVMPAQAKVARLYSPEELAHNCLDTILSTNTENQNKILRLIIGKVKDGRKANETRIATQLDDAQQNLKTAQESIEALEVILSGKLDQLEIS